MAPRRIEALASERMAVAAVGPNHCLAASAHGELFAFGRLHTTAESDQEKYFDMAVEMPGMIAQGERSRAMVRCGCQFDASMKELGVDSLICVGGPVI